MTTTKAASDERITGWEPDTPVGDTLLRRFVFAYADRIERQALRASGRAEGTVDARFADPGSPFGFDNAVVLLRPPTAVGLEATIFKARAFFPPERWWVLLSAWPLPDLSGHGLRLVGYPPLMFRPPAPLPQPPSTLQVLEVDGHERLADFQRTLVAGFPLPASSENAAVTNPDLLGDVMRLFVGYVGDRPVSVAGAAVGHDLVEVDWVATLPAARGRGYGTALTAAAIGVGPNLPAVLLGSDSGQPLYRRLGFVDLLRCTMWEVHP